MTKLAVEKKKKFLYESTVMDGVPIFSMFPLGLPAVDLRGFHGVLNSTTNVVLTEIERGLSFDEAVKRAQAMGIAETDPSADVDGWDAAFKVVALAIVLMGVPVKIEQVRRTGIRELSEEKIRSVRDAGMRYKLVCRAERRGLGVECTRSAGIAPGRRPACESRRLQLSDSFRYGCLWPIDRGTQPGH